MTFVEATEHASPLGALLAGGERDTTVALLEAAAARLRDAGWQRGHYGAKDGPNCIMGAVYWTARQEGLQAGVRAVQYVLEQRLRVSAIIWNDTVCPDAATAIDALLNTAKEVASDAL